MRKADEKALLVCGAAELFSRVAEVCKFRGLAGDKQRHIRDMRSVMMQILLLWCCLPMLSAATIVCLGDSLTAGKGLEEDQAYPALVESLARADGLDWRVTNAGVSGDTSAAGLRRLNWILKAKPEVLFIALGANDGLRGQSVEVLSTNLTAIIEKCRAAGTTVFMSGIQIPTNYGEDYRLAFAAVFPGVAQQHQVPLMPFLLEGVGGVPVLNQADGIHPTAEGQQQMATRVYAFLKPLIVK